MEFVVGGEFAGGFETELVNHGCGCGGCLLGTHHRSELAHDSLCEFAGHHGSEEVGVFARCVVNAKAGDIHEGYVD